MTAAAPSSHLPRWMQANGLQFAYLEEGQGPLVLCLHGFPETAWSLSPLLAALAHAGFHAVAPFLRGYAPTAIPPDGDYRPTTLARDVIALADHLGQGRPAFLVGHDWGAVAAYVASTLRPDRFPAIVTAAVPHPRRFLLRPSLQQLWRSRYIGFFQIRGIAERRLARDDFAGMEALLRRWSPTHAWHGEALAALKSPLRDPLRLAAALDYYRALPKELRDPEAWQLLSRPVRVPTRVIYGTDDGCIGPEMFADMAHLFSAELDVLPLQGVGHFMHREAPQAFAEAVISFLAGR